MKKLLLIIISSLLFITSPFSGICSFLPTHPFLLVNDSVLKIIKKDIRTKNWKTQSWQLLKTAADRYLRQTLEIPPRGGNWEQYYVSPVTGLSLVRGKQTGDFKWEHWDTATHQLLISDTADSKKDYDGVAIALIHDAWALGAMQLGLAFQISADKKYAVKAKQILLAYAALYPTLPERNRTNDIALSAGMVTGAAKIHRQNLNEAQWLINMLLAADFIWDQLTPDECNLLSNNLFYPAANIIERGISNISNIQCWRNTAIGMTGFLLRDERLIAKAMKDTAFGYFAQIRKGVTREGIWMDRSPTYHFFTLNALVLIAQAASNYGYPINFQPLRKMFTGPILMANAFMTIPAWNDSREVDLRGVHYLYEWGYSQFKDARYAHILNQLGKSRKAFKNTGPAFTGWNLLFGAINLPVTEDWKVTTKHFKETGISMISTGTVKNNLLLYLKYNPVVSGHTHRDVLGIALYKGAEAILSLPGATNYASLLHNSWYNTTMAHNTFTFIGRSQPATATGHCIAFGKYKRTDYTITETTNVLAGLRYVRTVSLLSQDVTIVIDQIQCDKKTDKIDIAFHPGGQWKELPPGKEWILPAKPGYNRLTNATIREVANEVSLSTVLKSGRVVTLNTAFSTPMNIITGYGLPYKKQKLPVALWRMNANQALMVTCISTNGQKIKISFEPLKDVNGSLIDLSKAARIILENNAGQKTKLIINPDQLSIDDNGTSLEKDFILEISTRIPNID